MLIASIDTSGRAGSLAVCRGDASSFAVLELSSLAGRMYSAELVPKLDHMLRAHQLSPRALEGVVVVSGPGSFTGLRVGLSTAKALAESLAIPIATVSMLEAIASAAEKDGEVVTALDAQRGEVYVGEYEVMGATAVRGCDSLQSLAHFKTWLKAKNVVPTVFTPDDSVVESLRSVVLPVTHVARPDAGQIGRRGLKKLLDGETVSAVALDANYIRKSDAEIFSAPQLGIL